MKTLLYSIIAVVILSGCGGKKKDNPTPPPPPPANPAQAVLVFPDQNSVCVSGVIVSDAVSTVQLKWNAAANTNSYDVAVKNLITGITDTHNTDQTQLNVDLQRNTPYSWSVTSKSTSVTATATSDTWKFYNAGLGVVSYAPFPADNLVPASGQFVNVPVGGKISITWHGSDTDNDILNYDVYFGTDASPALYQHNVTDVKLTGVPVTTKTKYYWKVVTFDSKGNSSTSDLQQFNTN
jgi:hypothetical protein